MLKSALKNTYFLSKYNRKFFAVVGDVITQNSQNTVEAGSSPVLNQDQKKMVSKLMEKDYQYFINLSEKTGIKNILTNLNEIASKYDASNASGREIISAKEEAITRLTYNERSVEEHQSHSIHICEKDLYKTYRLHYQDLEEKALRRTNFLREKSTANHKVLYLNQGSPLQKFKHLLGPSLMFVVPSFYIFSNSAFFKLTLGCYSPHLLTLSLLYIAYRRYSWLTNSTELFKENYIVSSLAIEDGNILKIESSSLTGNKNFQLNINNVIIQKQENELRREHLYIITDEVSKNKFVIFVDENSLIDEKILNFLSLKRYTEKDIYDVKSVILKGNNIVDLNLSNKNSNSIDTLARISILNQEGQNLNNLSQNELYLKIHSIPDSKVKEYLDNLESRLNSSIPKQEALIVEVSDFFVGLGVNLEEAQHITKILVTSLYVSNINDLKTISNEHFNEIFLQVNSNFNSTYPNFLSKLRVYFN